MKLGFITSILDTYTYEEVVDFAAAHGFECIETASWKQEKAERRYAGVCHIDAERVLMDNCYAEHVTDYAGKKGVEISALASYFFKGSHFSFNGVGETEIPGGIKSWTSSYTLSSTDYRPVFSIEESTYGGFDMYIGVEDKREKSPHIISLTEILGSSSYKFEKFRVLRSFTLISGLLKEVNEYIKCGARRPIHYTEETFVPFLMNFVEFVNNLQLKGKCNRLQR